MLEFTGRAPTHETEASSAACSSTLQHDVAIEQCVSWCRVQEAYHHCEWCKCRGCDFCAPVQSRTHVYATGDQGTVACSLASSTLQRGVEDDDVSLSECRETCDASFEARGDGGCHSFTYSEMHQRCELSAAMGKPRAFCARTGWQTHWRIEVSAEEILLLPSSAGESLSPAMDGTNVSDGTTPRRLLAHGARLIDSATGKSVLLTGVNFFVDYLEFDDIALMKQLLPTANLVRLVGIPWGDSAPDPTAPPGAVCAPSERCCVEDAASGYLAPPCLAALELAVERLGAAGLWVVVALKGRFAAGESWPTIPDVFHDSALAARVRKLWKHVATALRHLPMLAGYEVLSEPRNKRVAQQSVRLFYEGACPRLRHPVHPGAHSSAS